MQGVAVIMFIIILIKILYELERKKKNNLKETNNFEKTINNMTTATDFFPYTKEENIDDKVIINDLDELKQKPIEKESLAPKKEQIVDDGSYLLPKFEEIFDPIKPKKVNSTDFTKSMKNYIEDVFSLFNIPVQVIAIHIGPTITQYELKVDPNISFTRIIANENHILNALSNEKAKLQIPIPGKKTIGIEISNKEKAIVTLREVLESNENLNFQAKIAIPLGKNNIGNPIIVDLTSLQTLLIGGTSGSGKTVFLNSLISAILMRYKPNEIKMILIDTKKVEFMNYNGLPHLLCPVIGDSKKASLTLQRVVKEMTDRLQLFEEKEVKSIDDYNILIDKINEQYPEKKLNHMPYIVTIIDELADLMLVASKEVEDSLMQISKYARSTGIILVVATQRILNNLLSREILECFQSQISFRVSSRAVSHLILGKNGAEKLLGNGDMLFLDNDKIEPVRIQGCFVNDNELTRLVDYWKKQSTANYNDDFVNFIQESSRMGMEGSNSDTDDDYNKVVEFAIQTGKISASLIQRRFHFGYNQAANMMDLLEARGIVGPQNGSKPREVLVKLKENEDEK